jgi:hypothetical protein
VGAHGRRGLSLGRRPWREGEETPWEELCALTRTERRKDGGGGEMEPALVSIISRRAQVRGRSREGSELGDGALAAAVWEREEDGVGEKSGWLVDLTRHRWQPLATVGGSHLLAGCSCWRRERRPTTGQGLTVVDCLRHAVALSVVVCGHGKENRC